MKSLERRVILLEEGPPAIGARWAKGRCEEMRREGRAVAGGWPGTLPEARAQVTAYFDLELARRGLRLLTADELASATHITYQSAKREWLSANVAKESHSHRRSGTSAP